MQSTRIRVEFLSIFKWRELRFENSPQQWPGSNWKKGRKKKKRGTINSNTLSDVFVRLEIETRGKRWKGSFEFSIQWPCYFIRRSLIFYYFYLLIQIIPSKPNGSLLAWNKNSPNQLRAERTIRYFRKATLPRTIEKNNTHEIIFPALFLYKFTLRSLFYSKSFAIHYDFSIMFIECDIGACYVLIQNIARFRINIKQILHAWLKRGRGEREKKNKGKEEKRQLKNDYFRTKK